MTRLIFFLNILAVIFGTISSLIVISKFILIFHWESKNNEMRRLLYEMRGQKKVPAYGYYPLIAIISWAWLIAGSFV